MPRGPRAGLGAVVALLASALAAEPDTGPPTVVATDYVALAQRMPDRVTFEVFGTVPEPGLLIDGIYRQETVAIGTLFAGQELETARLEREQLFDALTGEPGAPLDVVAGPAGQTLALAYHPGLGSMAAFALGPVGFPEISALGEGALAVRFDRPQAATGFRLHADYADPLGSRPSPGLAQVTFYTADGRSLGARDIPLRHGPLPLAWRFPSEPAAGFTLVTTDPGGIAIDDILLAPTQPLG